MRNASRIFQFCYYCWPSMKAISNRSRSHLQRTALIVGVIACLCFSVGEGLRLTPFPVSLLTVSAAAPDILRSVIASPGISLHRYGPMDVPSKAQGLKRGKRHTVDCEFPPFPNARKLPANRTQRQIAKETVGLVSLLPTSQPADRAPPFTV